MRGDNQRRRRSVMAGSSLEQRLASMEWDDDDNVSDPAVHFYVHSQLVV